MTDDTTDAAPLTDETFAKVAGHSRPTRLTMDQVIELVKLPSGQRPRVYAYWRDQIVSVPSGHYVERYEGEARAWWLSGTTLADLIRRA